MFGAHAGARSPDPETTAALTEELQRGRLRAAVDVTDPGQLLQVLQGYTGPYKLVGGVLGPADPEHFSATGH